MEQPAFPTYAHPIEGITNRCYKCPPGYRINSEITEWDKCDISKTYPKTWPECLPCPDGYYSTEWSKDSFCIPQVRCDGKHELTEFAGTTSQRGLCICEPGYARIHDECVAISDTVLSTTIKPSNQYLPTCPPPTVCPPCPSTTISALLNQNTKGRSLDITPEYSQSQCNQDTVYIAIICALCCIIIVLVLYILKVKNKSAFKCGRKGNMEKKNRSIGQCDYAMVRQPTDDTPKKPVQGPAQDLNSPTYCVETAVQALKPENGIVISSTKTQTADASTQTQYAEVTDLNSPNSCFEPSRIQQEIKDESGYLLPTQLSAKTTDKEKSLDHTKTQTTEASTEAYYTEVAGEMAAKAEPITTDPEQVSSEAESLLHDVPSSQPSVPPRRRISEVSQRRPFQAHSASLQARGPFAPPQGQPSHGQGCYVERPPIVRQPEDTGYERPLTREESQFENASRIVEKDVITESDQALFFRHGLNLYGREIDILENTNRNHRVRKAIQRWKQTTPSNGVIELIEACERCHFNAIAEQIRTEISK